MVALGRCPYTTLLFLSKKQATKTENSGRCRLWSAIISVRKARKFALNESILALTARTASLIAPIVLAAYAFIFALVIICLVRVSRYFRTAGKEQKLIRMELGKVAEEVHLIR
jgi:hypothetical protein